jgi:hypothetical protein
MIEEGEREVILKDEIALYFAEDDFAEGACFVRARHV